MASGIEIRAQIDTENVKGLLLINGGASVALLAFLSATIEKPDSELFIRAILWGLLILQSGLVFAVIHNRLRRICCLRYEQHQFQPPPCKIWDFRFSEPCICQASTFFMWLSVLAFVAGGLTVFCGGINALDQKQATIERAKASQSKPVETLSAPEPQKGATR